MTMTDAAPPAVEIRGLAKRFDDVAAVDGIDLTIQPGDVFGFLGPNGAGKTTTLRMVLGLIRPTGGAVRLFGRDPHAEPVAALEEVAGFVEEPAFYDYLTARANLEHLSGLDGRAPGGSIDDVLERVGLGPRAHDRVGTFSTGMRQRLGIASALVRAPRLLILDEPTNGLDPPGMRDMRTLVRELSADGITILLSSHLMDEVEDLCTRLAVIRRGRILYEGTVDGLLGDDHEAYRLEAPDPRAALAISRSIPGLREIAEAGGVVRFKASRDAAAELSIGLGRAGVGIWALVPEPPSLERAFFDLIDEPGPA
jgi:ABC-2 type transport system ATP-binding protein